MVPTPVSTETSHIVQRDRSQPPVAVGVVMDVLLSAPPRAAPRTADIAPGVTVSLYWGDCSFFHAPGAGGGRSFIELLVGPES